MVASIRRAGLGRMLHDRTLDRTCTVKRPPDAGNDSRGQFDETPAVVAEDVKCAFSARSVREIPLAGSIQEVGDWILRFKVGVALKAKDVVEVEAKDEMPAKTFALVGPLMGSQAIGQRWSATTVE